MTFFDFVAGVAFGAIGGNLIFNHFVPLWMGLLALSLFSVLVLLSDWISLHSRRGRRLFEGKPIAIIRKGELDERKLRRTRLTVEDVLMLLRKKGVFRLKDIEAAYFETDGSISYMLKDGLNPVTGKELGLKLPSQSMPEALIVDGQVLEDRLRRIGKDRAWLDRQLEELKLEPEDVLVAQADASGDLYVSPRSEGP